MSITECLPRLEVYVKLQSESVLQVALLNVFADIVDFSVRAYQFFQSGALSRSLRTAWCTPRSNRILLVRLTRIIIRSFDQDVGIVIARLEHHAKAADQTAIATELLAAAKFRKEIQRRQEEDQKLSYERWLKPADMKSIHLQQLQTKLDGTCLWIGSHEAFVRWATPQCSAIEDRLLVISGSHGCGKSILASSIVENLEETGHQTLFFAFSNLDGSRQTAAALPRTFLWQLLQSCPGNESLGILRQLRTNGQPSLWELWDAFGSLVSTLVKPVFCVIDGVDECIDCNENMSRKFKHLLEMCPNLNILLLGGGHIMQARAERLNIRPLQITSAVLEQDITTFIHNEISKSDILSLPELRNRILSLLVKKSDGMFLWVKLMIDDLKKSSSQFEIEKRLQNSPPGLENAYRIMFLRISQRLDKFERRLAQDVFAFIIVACRPLRFDEIRLAHALHNRSLERPERPLEEFLLLQPLQRVINLLGGLVVVIDNALHLTHSSVKDFLVRSEHQWAQEPGLSGFRVDIVMAHRSFSWLCLDYMTMDKPLAGNQTADRTEIIRFYRKTYPFIEYASLYTFHHLNRSGPLSSTTLAKIESVLRSAGSIRCLEVFGHLQLEDLALGSQVDEFLYLKDRLEEMGEDKRLLAIFDQTLGDLTSQSRVCNGTNTRSQDRLECISTLVKTPKTEPADRP